MTHAGSLIEFLTSAVERAEARAAQSCADSFPVQAGEGTIQCVPASGPGLPLAPSPVANCPKCDSPAPHLHPAVQYEGEVEICRHPFHLTVTPQNTPRRLSWVPDDGVESVQAEIEAAHERYR